MWRAALLAVCIAYVSAQSLKSNYDLRQFCLIFALPGRENGPKISEFETKFNEYLEIAGTNIFGSGTTHAQRMTNTQNCSPLVRMDDYTAKCAYRRLVELKELYVADLNTLQTSIGSHADKKYMFIVYLSTWFFDNVFLALDCRVVDASTRQAIAARKYIAKWSNHLSDRSKFCAWVKPFAKTNAVKLRTETKRLCDMRFTEPICELEDIFDFVDSMDSLCTLRSTDALWSDNDFQYYKNSANIYFYSMRKKTPDEHLPLFNDDTTKAKVESAIGNVFTRLYTDFRDSKLDLAEGLVKVLPKSRYLPCDFTATFPTFEWLLCTCGRSFTELRTFVKTYKDNDHSTKRVKYIAADSREIVRYIQNLQSKQIEEVTNQQFYDLAVAAASIKNNIQDRFQELATYFNNVAEFEKRKVKADVAYLKGNIEKNQKAYNEAERYMKGKIDLLIGIYVTASATDLAEAIGKMVALCVKAANPIAAMKDGGNAGDRMDAATEIAEAADHLAASLASIARMVQLRDKVIDFNSKFAENDAALVNIREIIDTIETNTNANSETFDRRITQFLDEYNGYDPRVDRDELAGIEALWEGFIDDICDGLSSLIGVAANAMIGIAHTKGKCQEAKIAAAKMSAAIMTMYDEQFDLVEAMAQVVLRVSRMQASTIIGSGPRAENPAGLSTESIKTLTAVSTMSYTIVQTVNVYMLCDCYEFMFGKMPSICKGLATDLRELVSMSLPSFNEYKNVEFLVPTKNPSGKGGDFSWIDVERLYKGETVTFRMPDFDTLSKYGKVPESQRNYNFYLQYLEIFMPVVSPSAIPVKLRIYPTNLDNKLANGRTNYVITPSRYISIEYTEGSHEVCAKAIPNPYLNCGGNRRSMLVAKEICMERIGSSQSSEGSQLQVTTYFSMYAQFNLKLEGYQTTNLDPPGNNFMLPVSMSYRAINTPGMNFRKKRSSNLTKLFRKAPKEARAARAERAVVDQCCPGNKYYDKEQFTKCQTCPTGMKSQMQNLYCGEVVKTVLAPTTAGWAFNAASAGCTASGTVVAGETLFNEAKNTYSQKDCICGWVSSTVVDSLTPRSQCADTTPCSSSNAQGVYCKAKYQHV